MKFPNIYIYLKLFYLFFVMEVPRLEEVSNCKFCCSFTDKDFCEYICMILLNSQIHMFYIEFAK